MEKRTKTLVIDDDALTREFLRKVLERMDCTVTDAPNAKKGIEQYKADRPDAVFLDIILPDIHGGEVFEMLRSIDRSTKIFVISSSPGEADEFREKVDPEEIFIKPVDIGKIKEAVKALQAEKTVI